MNERLMGLRDKAAALERARITVRGAVQGVGFRPFVWRAATARGLSGHIANTPAGVTLEAEGTHAAIADLLVALRDAPAPATVASLARETIPLTGGLGFVIHESTTEGPRSTAVLPDLATCDECLAEIGDPGNRRYRYPFTNCTHCGPRYTIVTDLPYDRARTTMAGFVMCAACREEYEDPADRRFHAEPNACADCGPQVALLDANGNTLAGRDTAISVAADALAQGSIVAMKGLGGFHLMADARNARAVAALRERKHREAKPFAVMFRSLAAVRAAAEVSNAEAALLTGVARPIVLLHRRDGSGLAEAVAPETPLVGAMLPYTPLHHLLLAETGFALVATSGNRADEPICIDRAEAQERLAGIADLFLIHDRPIVRPVDDSVVRVIAGKATMLRRARGFAPSIVAEGVPPGVLAFGGHMKTTLALSTEGGVVLSQHLGDLDTAEARDVYEQALDDMQRLYDVHTPLVARDLHPDYYASRLTATVDAPKVGVQHHLAHVAACIAEHGLEPPFLGVAFDGTGLGTDGTVWGGEFLRVTREGWQRVAHLKPFRLPGGEAAVRQPRRTALGLLHGVFGTDAFVMTDLAPVADFTEGERAALATMLERGVSAPVATSAGRLFDGVSALLGLCQRSRYEGEAAMRLEWAAMEGANASVEPPSRNPLMRIPTSPQGGGEELAAAYVFAVEKGECGDPLVLDWQPAVEAIVADVRAGVSPNTIALRFHEGLAVAIAEVAARIDEPMVALSGGCFQNALLTEMTVAALEAKGLSPVRHEKVPPNDGGLSLGQAWWAARFAGAV